MAQKYKPGICLVNPKDVTQKAFLKGPPKSPNGPPESNHRKALLTRGWKPLVDLPKDARKALATTYNCSDDADSLLTAMWEKSQPPKRDTEVAG